LRRTRELVSIRKGNRAEQPLDPIAGAGNKKLTAQEEHWSKKNEDSLEKYATYAEQLKDLKTHCSLTADLRGLFDNIKEPIYFDGGHTGYRGNQIIAEKMYELSLPIIKEKIEGDDSTQVNLYPIANVDNIPTSNYTDTIFIETIDTLNEIVSSYKTPKVFSLIFQ